MTEGKVVWIFYCPRCKAHKRRNFGVGRVERKLCYNCMHELYPDEKDQKEEMIKSTGGGYY